MCIIESKKVVTMSWEQIKNVKTSATYKSSNKKQFCALRK